MNNRYAVLGIVLTVMLGAMTAAQSAGVVYTLYGPYGVGQATNLAGVSIGKVTGSYSNGTFYNAQVWLNESSTLYGPYGVGQATNIPNVSIGKATANFNTTTNTIVNAQVWLNESSSTSAGNTYSFQTYIGSVLNGGITSGSLISTKSYQTSYPYAFLDTLSITNEASPYSASGAVPINIVPSISTAGGISFTGPGFVSSNYDNIMQINSSELPVLVSNYGLHGESEYLWLTGFPVYDQQPSVNYFQVMSAGGAYQITFNKPINAATAPLNMSFQIFGENATVVSARYPSVQVSNNLETAPGGTLTIMARDPSVITIKKDSNVTDGNFTIGFVGPLYISSNNITGGDFNIYYNNVLTNSTYGKIGSTVSFNVSGNYFSFYVKSVTKSTAKIELYNEYVLTNGHTISNNPGWVVNLLWTNTYALGGTATYLQSIIVYNQTPTNLLPGQSFSFVTIAKGKHYSLSFIGDISGSANYDQVTATVKPTTEVNYQNLGSGPSNVTEPASELVVQSTIPNAFLYAGQASSTVTYDLTPYEFLSGATSSAVTGNSFQYIILNYSNSQNCAWVTASNPLSVIVTGYSRANNAIAEQEVSFTACQQEGALAPPVNPTFYNITGIQMLRALPGAINISIIDANASKVIQMGKLRNVAAPAILIPPAAGKVWDGLSLTAGNVIYNQQNGNPATTFSLAPTTPAGSGAQEYFTYTMGEIASTTGTKTDQLAFGIYNSSAGVNAGTLFSVNRSVSGVPNNITYVSTQGTAVIAGVGFRTERGSKVSAISPSTLTLRLAKQVGTLVFKVHS